ncbi:MAG: exodeoxyribonuclease VII small subunit [Oscillospiraceae bacterium]|jgi:exodeoxyribonuclease VII small subunit|nr:exodeoxyribonuclease VII small subunit [Oscillospiraceae bacterium]
MGFEDKLKNLEMVTKLLEDGQLSLEEAVNAYSRGMKLAAQCKTEIEKAKIKLVAEEWQLKTKKEQSEQV